MEHENVNEILGIEESHNSQEKSSYNDADSSHEQIGSPEATLKTIATIVLWVGIVCTIFCLFTITTTKVVDPTFHYTIHYDTIFNPVGLAISFGVFLSSLTTWALLRVVANISINLKEINSKIK